MPRGAAAWARLTGEMVAAHRVIRGVGRLRWASVLVAGAAVGMLTVLFVYQAVYVLVATRGLVVGGEQDQGSLDVLVRAIGVWGALAFFGAAVTLAAYMATRRIGELAVAHGVALGMFAALVQQGIVYLTAPPVRLGEALALLALGTVGGWVGAREGRRTAAGQESAYRAIRDVARAGSAEEVVSAIGRHLADGGTEGVSIWHDPGGSDAQRGTRAELLAWWSPRGRSDPPPGAGRGGEPGDEVLEAFRGETWTVTDAPASGSGRVLLVPLVAGARRVGVLAVAFSKEARLHRGVVRQYLTVGSQAALAVEGLRLAEENRRMGEEAGVLRERQRLAHEIHDTLAQGFASIVTNLTAVQMVRDSRDEASAEELERRHLERARSTARENLSEARRLVWALRPEPLERDPLPDALGKLVDGWSRETGVDARATVTGKPVALPQEAEDALLRIAQEALTNARKHARAGRVVATLSYMEDAVALDVADDGRGFDASAAFGAASTGGAVAGGDRGGFGLTAMRERAEQLGGAFLLESCPGGGTTVAVEIPVGGGDAGATAPERAARP